MPGSSPAIPPSPRPSYLPRSGDATASALPNVRAVLARVLRLAVVLSLLGAVLVQSAAPAGVGRQSLGPLDAGVLGKLNAIRSAHGLSPLHPNARLSAAAPYHCRELAAHGYFAHTSAGGGAFWKRIERWYAPRAGGSWSVG